MEDYLQSDFGKKSEQEEKTEDELLKERESRLLGQFISHMIAFRQTTVKDLAERSLCSEKLLEEIILGHWSHNRVVFNSIGVALGLTEDFSNELYNTITD